MYADPCNLYIRGSRSFRCPNTQANEMSSKGREFCGPHYCYFRRIDGCPRCNEDLEQRKIDELLKRTEEDWAKEDQ